MNRPTPGPILSRPLFVTTRWSQVLAARGGSAEAQVALGDLCQAYWLPVYRFIRNNCGDENAAGDLTQEFFARLMAQHGLDGVERGRGRFRSYLLGAVKHFLADQRDRAAAHKRGGGEPVERLDVAADAHTTTCVQIPDPSAPMPDAYFDRQWALNVIDRALTALASDYGAMGKGRHFEVLKPWLVGDASSLSQAEAARELGLTEGAIKVVIHRLRRRFRELVKAEIMGTIAPDESVQAELGYLLEALARK